MAKAAKILVVCTGNICRSPMGAALLRHALAAQPEPLSRIEVSSAGVASRNGDPASANAVAAMKKVGIDISGHSSRRLTQQMLDESLMVLCMTESHRDMIELSAEPVPTRLHLFREFEGAKPQEIADPYGQSLGAYEASRDEMVAAIPSIIAHLAKLPPELLGPS